MSPTLPPIEIAAAQRPLYWGVDIGGTNLKIGLVDSAGSTVVFEKLPTEEPRGAQAAVDRIAQRLEHHEGRLELSPADVPRIGLGSPGTMDLPRGRLIDPPNLPHWWYFPLRDALATAAQRTVSFVNDANAAAFGEFWLGTGRNHHSMILLTLGTGVGGGIIVGEQLIHGVNSFGSECGHLLVDSSEHARLCVWGGGRGQLEAYASASAVVQRTRERLTAGATSSLGGPRAGVDGELTAHQIYQAARAGDPLALEIVDETAFWLGVGITSMVHLIDPGLVVLGGAMDFGGPRCPVGQRFLGRIRQEFSRRTFDNVDRGTTIDFAQLGADAGYLGAAGFARHEHLSYPVT